MANLYPIEKDFTNVNMGGWNNPQWIIIHFVGAAGQARDNANYFRDVYREASAHYFVDPHRIVQVVPDNRQAWHIGDGYRSGKGQFNGYHRYGATNSNSIGIEGCQDVTTGNGVWHWDFHPKTYEQMLLLTKHLQKKYNIPDSRVIRHFDASGKMCPGNWQWNNWAKWHQFKKDLANMKDGNIVSIEDKPSRPAQSKDMYTVQVGDTLSKIAMDYQVAINDLVEWNNIENPNLIYPETRLIVKSPGKKEPGLPQTGRFRFNTTVNVRNEPKASGPVPAQYAAGDVVYYEGIKEIDGMLWMTYTSYSGEERWISAGTKDKPYGEFMK
ncbi:N-acetylmuramoyl-L-alanine amidase [Facklamia hominis]|uniref:N-acetylmuramoyl-L-alanine amidase n=1 Tax=Facklamia hominis TaxID=178214 RepID=A0AAJ1V1S5_9LACT|nr:N-acetylmuramoyl-L-alanine amidase [Facklamia hominis]MDK7186845.1 N-acetylmuramoyl-L-alanine amidase [Facklamia hominis]